MATRYSPPPMVTSGLVLALDSANRKSYPGSGTSWNDLTLNNSAATLNNSPTFSTENVGNFSFNGTNNYITVPYSSALDVNNFSVSFVFKTSTNDNSHDTICARNGDVYSSQNGWSISRLRNGLSLANCLRFYIWGNAVGMEIQGPAVSDNIWRHATITVSSTPSVFMKIYINGVIYNTTNALPGGNFYSGTPQFKIGVDKNNTDFWTGNIANMYYYNKTLTDTEVLQNFNSLRSRYGL